MFDAVQQQLGLKLQARKQSLEILVIDHVEKRKRRIEPNCAIFSQPRRICGAGDLVAGFAVLWGRLSICGRLAIGLRNGAQSARRIANPPQDTILPHV
jgi:hypothetical protein